MHISKEEDDVSTLIKTRNPYSGKAALQETMVQTGLVSVVPLRTKTVHKGKRPMFRYLHNRVNRYRVRKIRRGKSVL